MLVITIPLDIFIISLIVVMIIILSLYLFIRQKKKMKNFIANVIHLLMKSGMENIQYFKRTRLYNISFKNNNNNYAIKIYKGGSKKGFIMTNPSTIHATTYSSQYGPVKDSKQATKLIPFLIEPFNGKKIILIYKNMLRITKYINENEIEEVKYDIPSFGTYIVQEKDLSNFIEYIKNKKNKR